MNTILIFAIGVSINVCQSIAMSWLLAKPLVNILEDLCPTKNRRIFAPAQKINGCELK